MRLLRREITLDAVAMAILWTVETLSLALGKEWAHLDSLGQTLLFEGLRIAVLLTGAGAAGMFIALLRGLVRGIASRRRSRSGRPRGSFEGLLLGLLLTGPMGLFVLIRCATLINPEYWRLFIKFVLFTAALCGFAGWSLARTCGLEERGQRENPLLALTGLLLLVALYAANTLLFVRLYAYIHTMIWIASFFIARWLALNLLPRDGRRAPLPSLAWMFLFLAAALLVGHFGMGRSQNVKRAIGHRTTVSSEVLSQLRWVLDLDRDGYSALLGGGDRNDLAGSVNPGARDVRGNGIDEDGQMGDRPALDGKPRVPFLPPEAGPVRHVILLSIDDVRPDRLGIHGEERPTSPNIDAFARRGILYTNAFSPGVYTYITFPSIFYGSYFSSLPERPGSPSLPEVLRREGFRSAAIYPVERGVEHMVDFGIDMESVFDTVTTIVTTDSGLPEEREAWQEMGRLMTDTAIGWIRDNGDRPFFLWVHYYDPHHYTHVNYRPHPEMGDWGEDRYGELIAYTDRQIGRLLRFMDEEGILDESLVVIFADHGEEFGEHGGKWHRTSVYDELIRVPLILSVPGMGPAVVAHTVSTIDIYPTVLDLLGIREGLDCQGVNLLRPLRRPEASRGRPIFSETEASYHKKAVVADGWKLIYDFKFDTFELYDLETDPAESKNLFEREPERAERLKQTLFREF